jgi:hypothetical protein
MLTLPSFGSKARAVGGAQDPVEHRKRCDVWVVRSRLVMFGLAWPDPKDIGA